MNLNGKFTSVSKTDHHDGVILVGFCGDVYQHDLRPWNIQYLKSWYSMPPDCKHEICSTWPEEIEPAYPAAKKNFINGFLLLRI